MTTPRQKGRPSFYLLDATTGWRTSDFLAHGVSHDPAFVPAAFAGRQGLRLQPLAAGPLGFGAADESLGGLLLPRGMAFDGQRRLCLVRSDGRHWQIRRFDPEADAFADVPGANGAFVEAVTGYPSLVVADGLAFLAGDGLGTVQVRPLEAAADPESLCARVAARLAARDLALWRRRLYVVAGDGSAVLALSLDDGRHRIVARAIDAADPIRRIAVATDGSLLLIGTSVRLLDGGPGRHKSRMIDDPDEVRTLFPEPALRLWYSRDDQVAAGVFHLPEALARDCDRRFPKRAPPPHAPLAFYAGDQDRRPRLFDRHGTPAEPPPVAEPMQARYRTTGTWLSAPLDSGIHNCQWHRIEVDFGDLPLGSEVLISTFAIEETELPRIADDAQQARWLDPHVAHVWDTAFRAMPSAGHGAPPGLPSPTSDEFLIQSRGARYLMLKVELTGTGACTPRIDRIRVHYPRRSGLDFLPAVYSSEERTKDFLGRFLSIFQTRWDQLEGDIEAIPAWFDPQAVPDGPDLDFLCAWFAVPLGSARNAAGKRRLLRAALGNLARRGTRRALHDHLGAALANISGVDDPDIAGFPRLVEGFRLRRRLRAADTEGRPLPGSGGLGAPARLWSDAIERRLRLGRYATLGAARLRAKGDTESDYLRRHANELHVFVPSGWLDGGIERARFDRAIEEEKPAGVRAIVHYVEPRLRLGVQCTLGLDTIVGRPPAARTSGPTQEVPPEPRGAALGNGALQSDPDESGTRPQAV